MPVQFHNCQQGSIEWLRLRMGRPTASQFHRIITPTGKESAQAEDYIHELVAELIMGHPIHEEAQFAWAVRGKELESRAREYYELLRGQPVKTVGFCTNWNGAIGASPDGLVGDDTALELKCPSPAVHTRYLFKQGHGVDRAYYPQVQGQLFVLERDRADILSYHPDMPEALITVGRDEKFIVTLDALLRGFCARLESAVERAKAEGWIRDPEPWDAPEAVYDAPLERRDIDFSTLPKPSDFAPEFDEFDAAIFVGEV